MLRKKILISVIGAMLVVVGASGLAGCASGEDLATDVSQSVEATPDVADDLQNARQVIADTLAEDDSWEQIMLASDVDNPTVKYGLMVVPFTHSEAATRVQSTITIDDGAFTIEAESAATGDVWRIDQDGAITNVTE